MAKYASIIEHDRIIASDRMIPTGARPSADPNLANPEKVAASAPTIPTETPDTGWTMEEITKLQLVDSLGVGLTDPTSFTYMNSGNQMLVYDNYDNSINCYSLSTPYSVSSASFDDKCAVVGDVVEMWVDDTGSYVFLLRETSSIGSVNIYTMSTPFDITTISFDNRISIGEGYWKGMYVSTNGYHLYVGSTDGYIKHIYMHFPLNFGWTTDLETVKVSGATSIDGLVINPAGDNLYVIDANSQLLKRYTLSTAYYISDHTYSGLSFSLTGLGIRSLFIEDATYLNVFGITNDIVYRYKITLEDWIFIDTFSNYLLDGIDVSISNPWGFTISEDGVNLYVVSVVSANISWYTMSTPYNISTASLAGTHPSGISDQRCCRISPDGTHFYSMRGFNSTKTLYSYSLSTPFDITSASSDSSIVIGGSFAHFEISADGSKLFTFDNTTKVFSQWSLGTEWDISTASFIDTVDFNPTLTSTPQPIKMNSIGTEAIIGESVRFPPRLTHWTLSTPFDLNSATYQAELADIANSYDVCAAGNHIYVCDYATSKFQRLSNISGNYDPLYGLKNNTSGVYLSIDDFIPNSEDLIIELDYKADASITTVKYHGIVYNGPYFGHWYSNGQRWNYGLGNGITDNNPAFNYQRATQRISAYTNKYYLDGVEQGEIGNALSLTSVVYPFPLWKSIQGSGGSAGQDYTPNSFATIYAFRAWKAGTLIRELLPVPAGETLYNATTPAPSNCFWDTATERYYEATADVLTIEAI